MSEKRQVVLITGSARRIGACIASTFHQDGYDVIVHYRHSIADAKALVEKLNRSRAESAVAIKADLDAFSAYEQLIADSIKVWGRLDVLINNASTFFPTPMGQIQLSDWDNLFNSNLKAPLFLAQSAMNVLAKCNGSIINIVDVHALHPMKNYPVYSCAKAGLAMLTQSLAMELAPIRVNAIAPGNVLWPEGKNNYSEDKKKDILFSTALKKQITPDDIAKTAIFLAQHTSITGQMICVDGGRFLS